MLVVFADNQCLVDDGVGAGGTIVTTDPVAVGGNDRATAVTNVHRLFTSGTGLTWLMEGSADGQTWVDMGPVLAPTTSEAASLQGPTDFTLRWARLKITFKSASSTPGAAIFDIHVNFDHT